MNLNELRPSSAISTRIRERNKNQLTTPILTRAVLIGCLLLVRSLFVVPVQVQSQNYNLAVDDASQSMTFTSNLPGEAQSTVVPPGIKSQCTAGRVLITNDRLRPPDGGSVVFRDLNSSSTAFTNTSFAAIPLPTGMFKFGTNDHDIITMPNGNVILIWGIHFATTLNPKPGWFDVTIGANLGSGVRRGVMVWRSQDCGQSFQYMGQVDPAATADGSCAFPQYRRDPTTKDVTSVKPYANGGVDGQLIQLDPATKRIYLMFQCVGQKPDLTQSSFTLTKDRLKKTMVLMSPDEGATWNMLGWLNTTAWRYGVVAMSQDRLAFGSSNVLSFGLKNANGTYKFDQTAFPTSVALENWSTFDHDTVAAIVYANIYGHTIITRVPGAANGVLIAYTNSIQSQGKNTNGYSLFFYDRTTNQYAEADPILPLNKDANSFTMHLTAVDLGTGPILLYWYDINWTTQRATIRGRLVTGPQKHSGDFQIYRATAVNGIGGRGLRRSSSFALGSSKYWYGDYKTAGGYSVGTQMQRLGNLTQRPQVSYNYFPLWVQPDNTVRYIRVRVELGPTRSVFKPLQTRVVGKWRPGPSPVELSERKFSAAELRIMLNHDSP